MIYFSNPYINDTSRHFNLELTGQLERAGLKVFLPQRDGVDAKKPQYAEMTRDERRLATFEMSRDFVIACNVFLFLTDGRVLDEGVCFELGLAYAHRLSTGCDHYIIALQTDGSVFLGAKLNPMIKLAVDNVVSDREALVKTLVRRQEGMST